MALGDNLTDFTTFRSTFSSTVVDVWISRSEKWVNKIKGRTYTGGDITDDIEESAELICERIVENNFIRYKVFGKDFQYGPIQPLTDFTIKQILEGEDPDWNEFDIAFKYRIR